MMEIPFRLASQRVTVDVPDCRGKPTAVKMTHWVPLFLKEFRALAGDKRTVVIVVPNLVLGGAERQAVALARVLSRFGWRAVLVAAELHGPQLELVRREGIPLYNLKSKLWLPKWHPRFWIELYRSIARLARICRREKAVVLQSFLFWQNQLAVPASLLAKCVRVVIIGRRNTGEYKDRRWHYQWIENFANLFTSAVVCNSEGVREDAIKRELIRHERVTVIPNGVDVDHFNDSTASLECIVPKRTAIYPMIITVGNMKRQKRHDIFLRTVAELRSVYPHIGAVIVGGDRGELTSLTALRSELNLEDVVTFAGTLPDAATVLGDADVFLLTSDHEGMPNVLLEAMAAGVPVVSRRVAGVEEILDNGRVGMIVESGDVKKLAAAVRATVDNSKETKRRVELARRRVERRFSVEAMGHRYAQLYQRLLAGRLP